MKEGFEKISGRGNEKTKMDRLAFLTQLNYMAERETFLQLYPCTCILENQAEEIFSKNPKWLLRIIGDPISTQSVENLKSYNNMCLTLFSQLTGETPQFHYAKVEATFPLIIPNTRSRTNPKLNNRKRQKKQKRKLNVKQYAD